jgi:tRNA uridine 5-carboxymethylaminomethyl modification enzyme
VETQRLSSTWIQPDSSAAQTLAAKLARPLSHEYSLADLLRRPELEYADLSGLAAGATTDPQVAEQVEIQAKYAGYIDRQRDDIARLKRYENMPLAADIDYLRIEGLSNEVKQKLSAAQPGTLARASRIPGVTPAAISLLLIHLKKRGALDRRIA